MTTHRPHEIRPRPALEIREKPLAVILASLTIPAGGPYSILETKTEAETCDGMPASEKAALRPQNDGALNGRAVRADEAAPQTPEIDGGADGEEVPGSLHAAAAVVTTIGRRLAEARELTGWTQTEAAARLGITQAKLAAFETPVDRQKLPLWLIPRAAEVYEVSVDFLFGAMDDWETGARMTQERKISAWVFRELDQARLEQMEWLRRLNDRIECAAHTITTLSAGLRDVDAALARFAELNPEFVDMRAGATLAGSVERASKAADGAVRALRRFHLDMVGAPADDTEEPAALAQGATA